MARALLRKQPIDLAERSLDGNASPTKAQECVHAPVTHRLGPQGTPALDLGVSGGVGLLKIGAELELLEPRLFLLALPCAFRGAPPLLPRYAPAGHLAIALRRGE